MKELSLNILDIVENSTKAGASLTEILIDESCELLTIVIRDNGCGMDKETLESVKNPFYTTRTTRKVGLGIPLFTMASEQTGGKVEIESSTASDSHGTTVKATFYKNHMDFTPLGDIISTVVTIIQGHDDRDFLFVHNRPEGQVSLDTRELREVLGDISLSEFEILNWIREHLSEQYKN